MVPDSSRTTVTPDALNAAPDTGADAVTEAVLPRSRWRALGPGLIAAATGVGAGDLIATLAAGSAYGYTLFWAVVLGVLVKIALGEGVGRYHLATRGTILRGWRSLGRWTSVYFGLYVVVWGFIYGATAMTATGTLTQKHQRQSAYSVSTPPSSSPTAEPPPAIAP